MAYLLQFGSYVFPSTFFPMEDPSVRRIFPAALPRSDYARVLTGYRDRKVLRISGGLLKDASTTLRTKIDSLRSALAGGPANLYFGSDDRYYRSVQAEDIRDSYQGTWFNRIARVEISLVTGDPFQFSTTLSTNTEAVAASGETWVVTAGGNAYAQPLFRITVGGAGAQTIAFTIANNTTGESFTLAGSVTGGDVIVVDTLEKTVVIGAADKISLFDGQWPTLAVGSNTLQEDYTSGTITQVVTEWRNRWH